MSGLGPVPKGYAKHRGRSQPVNPQAPPVADHGKAATLIPWCGYCHALQIDGYSLEDPVLEDCWRCGMQLEPEPVLVARGNLVGGAASTWEVPASCGHTFNGYRMPPFCVFEAFYNYDRDPTGAERLLTGASGHWLEAVPPLSPEQLAVWRHERFAEQMAELGVDPRPGPSNEWDWS